jgi:hypothetical protein
VQACYCGEIRDVDATFRPRFLNTPKKLSRKSTRRAKRGIARTRFERRISSVVAASEDAPDMPSLAAFLRIENARGKNEAATKRTCRLCRYVEKN